VNKGGRPRVEAHGAYLWRVVKLTASRPLEALDRLDARRQARRADPRWRQSYGPTQQWEARLHEILKAEWPCPLRPEWEAIWDDVARLDPPLHGHDMDPALARTVWCAANHSGATCVVETGVARGIGSRFLLESFHRRGTGHLWSIDFPPQLEDYHNQVGAAVPERLRDRWTYVRGSSRRKLHGVLSSRGQIDMFVHDSLPTSENVHFELELAWQWLRPRGVLVVNCIDRGEAFGAFLDRHPPTNSVIGSSEVKSGEEFAVVVK
jgi:Methyltransferase domain